MKSTGVSKGISQMENIDGWFKNEAALLIGMLDEFHRLNGISGNIFEIGVHHGRSSIFLSYLLQESEKLNVCDLFGEDGNLSNSGSGNESIFQKNMKSLSEKQVSKIYKCLSSKLTRNEIGNNYRLFHVDGGHNVDEAFQDINLAAEVLHAKGMIIVDDPFRDEWPGVTEAILKFLGRNNEFECTAVGFNKLFLSRKEISQQYRQWMISNFREYGFNSPYEFKHVPFAGTDIAVFFIPQRYIKYNWKFHAKKFFKSL
jgi:hypothetical protein